MKTILAVMFRDESPDEGWLQEMLVATGSDRAIISTPTGSLIGDVHHERLSSSCSGGPCKVKWYSRAVAPLAKLASTGDHDAVFLIHDDVKPSSEYGKLKEELNGFGFISTAYVTVGFPPVQAVDYTDRCVLWSKDALEKYMTSPIPESQNTHGKTTLELIMGKMDNDGVMYKFSEVQATLL